MCSSASFLSAIFDKRKLPISATFFEVNLIIGRVCSFSVIALGVLCHFWSFCSFLWPSSADLKVYHTITLHFIFADFLLADLVEELVEVGVCLFIIDFSILRLNSIALPGSGDISERIFVINLRTTSHRTDSRLMHMTGILHFYKRSKWTIISYELVFSLEKYF